MYESQVCRGFLMDPDLWARLAPEAPGLAGYPLANGLTIVIVDNRTPAGSPPDFPSFPTYAERLSKAGRLMHFCQSSYIVDRNLSMNATVEASVWEVGQPIFGPEVDEMTWTIDESHAFRKMLCRLLGTLDISESPFSELGLFPFQEMSQDAGPRVMASSFHEMSFCHREKDQPAIFSLVLDDTGVEIIEKGTTTRVPWKKVRSFREAHNHLEWRLDSGQTAKLPLKEFDALPLKQAWIEFTYRHLPGT